ncbi:hypothetical protein ON010_g154 [Phytophthora cinnamomi]|nr:hypothetical protein ON010_g154 [Phytophthora cinnamomi]
MDDKEKLLQRGQNVPKRQPSGPVKLKYLNILGGGFLSSFVWRIFGLVSPQGTTPMKGDSLQTTQTSGGKNFVLEVVRFASRSYPRKLPAGIDDRAEQRRRLLRPVGISGDNAQRVQDPQAG